MPTQPSLIMIQFLQWVADRPRSREDVMDAWRSSCPRFPVWEDARADGLIRQCGGERGEHRVELTERGRAGLGQSNRALQGRGIPGDFALAILAHEIFRVRMALRRADVRPRSTHDQAAASGSGP